MRVAREGLSSLAPGSEPHKIPDRVSATHSNNTPPTLLQTGTAPWHAPTFRVKGKELNRGDSVKNYAFLV